MSESEMIETPPQPEEVLGDERIQYQAMTDLSDDKYHRLTKDICENGMVEQVVIDDSDEMRILDGHHREAIYEYHDLTESEHAGYTVLGGRDETEKLTRAIKQNILGRDSTESVKTHAVKQYIRTAWDTTDDGELIRPETDTEVAEKLGVSRQLVTKVANYGNDTIIGHPRLKAREYYEENPDASYREVAEQVDASNKTVTEWLKEDFDEGDDDDDKEDEEHKQQKINAQAPSKEKATKAAELSQKSQELSEDNAPDEVMDTVEKKMDEVERGEKYRSGTQIKQEYKEQKEREQRETKREQAFNSAETVVETYHGDFQNVLDDYEDEIDHIITDPPYDEDALDQWRSLGEIAAEILPDGGFLIAYSGKAHLPAVHDVLSESLNYYWQAIVTHKGGSAKIFSRKLRTGYKPIVVYQKGELQAQEDFVSDVVEGGGREKDDHDWQQAESESADLIERFTATGDTVCDPMCGSGTVGVACQRLKRRAVLIDQHKSSIETARRKVSGDE